MKEAYQVWAARDGGGAASSTAPIQPPTITTELGALRTQLEHNWVLLGRLSGLVDVICGPVPENLQPEKSSNGNAHVLGILQDENREMRNQHQKLSDLISRLEQTIG